MRPRIVWLLSTLLLAQLVLGALPAAAIASSTSGVSLDIPQIRFIQLSAGRLHTCGLTTIQTIICWGDNEQGQADVPNLPGAPGFIEVSAGYEHTCGLTNTRQVICWGADNATQSSPPPSIQTVTLQVSAGNDFSCALTIFGSVTCWGLNNYGQATPPSPPLGTTFTAVRAGAVFACALTTDLRALCWGDIPVPLVQPIEQLTSGAFDACGLTTAQAVFCWGSDATHGQTTVPPGYTFQRLDAGLFHACGLTIDESVVCWGWNNGPGGAPAGQVSDTPDGVDYQAVSAGGYHSCALTITGEATCWGYNAEHQTAPAPGPPTITQPPDPQSVIVGANLALSVVAISEYFVGSNTVTLPQTYQWLHDGQAIPGATDPTLTIAQVGFQDEGDYAVVVTNEFGSVTSGAIQVTVSYGVELVISPSRVRVPGQGVLIGIRLVDASGANRSSPAIAVTALDIEPAADPWDGQRPNHPQPFFFVRRLGRGGSGYLLLVNTRRLSRGSYLLYFRVSGDPQLHTIPFRTG